jgi:ABC-type sugar transport system ATPase subunit
MYNGYVQQLGTPKEIYDTNLLPGRIAPDGSHVILADGQIGPLPQGWRSASAHREVLFGVRPEALGFVPMAGGTTLSMMLDFQEELGMGRLFHGHMDGQEVIVHSSDRTPPVPFGQTVEIHLSQSDVHLFDAASGARLMAEAAVHAAAE